MTTDISMSGLDLARIKREGSPIHPDDVTWEHYGDECEICALRYKQQLEAYNTYWKLNSVEEVTDE